MAVGMVYILKTVLGCNGELISRETLPVAFDAAKSAKRFLHYYIAHVYADGRRGYDTEHVSWWGCDVTASTTLHRYTLTSDVTYPARRRP
jgi:hypothetical protein